YIRTGGPYQVGALAALKVFFDRSIPRQNAAGYWCYGAQYGIFGCSDSSTTQLMMGGLAAAKTVFSDPAYSDPVRLAQLNTATALARSGYAVNGRVGSDGTNNI